MKNPNGTTETALRDEVSELREKLTELTARLQMLEGEDQEGPDGTKVSSRRDLLKLAGALAAGAAGGLVLRPIPAAAASGTAMMLGQANDANAPTDLSPTALSSPTSLFRVLGQKPPTIPANPVNDVAATAVTVPVLLAIGPDGVFPVTVVSPGPPPVLAPIYPGVAPVQGIGGPVVQGTGLNLRHVAEGIDGYAAVLSTDNLAVGAGVVGQSDNGIGVVGSAATDLAALGAGYIAQTSITDVNNKKIAGPPPFPVYDFEQARDKDGALWLSTLVTSPAADVWRRMNTVIPINPFRVYDSRPSARPANSFTTITIAGVGGVPVDAIGVFGNLTAIQPAADGFLAMFPAGSPLGQFNNLNYTRGVSAVSNFVMIGLGGGQVTVFVSGNGATNFLFDVGGYLR
jgi:hypothetical protein